MTSTQKAILAGGCFWGMQDLIRKQPGVVSTRVGYTGGDVPNATYRNHGTHAEAIEIVLRPDGHRLPHAAGVLLPDPRPDNEEPAGQRQGAQLPVGHLLPRRRAEANRAGHHRRRRGLRPMARQGGDRGQPGRRLLGGRARASGLPASATPTDTPATTSVPAGSCRGGPSPTLTSSLSAGAPRSGRRPSGCRRHRGSASARPAASVVSIVKWRNTVRSTTSISMLANAAPTHRRVPPPNGIQAKADGLVPM